MDPRAQFLHDVGEQLPVPQDVRGEILEELASHLTDTVAELVAQGRDPDAARDEAIRRLGDPATLARALTTAHRRPSLLLSAVGAGAWAAVRTALPTTLVAWTAIASIALLASLAIRLVGSLLGLELTVTSDLDWGTVLGAAGLNVGALVAGGAVVAVVADRSWRARSNVRLTVAVVGFSVAAAFAWAAVQATLTWPGVITLLLVPVSFAVGTRFERLRPPTAIIALLSVTLAFGIAVASSVAGASANHGGAWSWDERSVGYEMIAPWWQNPYAQQDPADPVAADFPSGSSGGSTGRLVITIDAASPAVLERFHDFRLEAWRAEPPGDGWRLVPGQSAPFATAVAVAGDGSVTGTIGFDRAPGVTWAYIAVTAIGPDGRRYLLFSGSGPQRTEFHGSVVDWFRALGD